MAAYVALTTNVYAAPPDSYRDRLDIPSAFTPRAVKSNLTGIAHVGKNYVAVGEGGHVLISSDNGKNWDQSSVPLSSPLVAVSFPTPKKGWAVGHDGVILHSEDGGKHWQRQLDGRQIGGMMVAYYEKLAQGGDERIVKALDEARRFKVEGASKPFMDVYFENEQSGWAIGTFNLILKTSDGGKTWEPWLDRTDNKAGYSLHAISAVDGGLYIVGELGLLLRLNPQKNRFEAIKSPYGGTFFGMTGKPGVTFIYGLLGNLFRSRDRGTTWEKIPLNMESALVGGTFLKDGDLVLVSNGGHILVSKDNGDTFQSFVASKDFLSAVAAIDSDSVLVVGHLGVHPFKLK